MKYLCRLCGKEDDTESWLESTRSRVLVCGVDCHPGDANCNNYCNRAPQKGPMAAYPPKGPDA